MSDIERIRKAGMERVDVTVGGAPDLSYNEVVAWHDKQVIVNR